MMNPRLLLPLLCLLLAACSSSEVLTLSQPMRIKSVLIKGIGDDGDGTFETYEMCRNIRLSEADIREFFEKSRAISDEELKRLESEGRVSACRTKGTLEWEDGERTDWSINRARIGIFYCGSPNCDGGWHYCDTCDSERRYSIEPGDLEQFRPKVKTATIIGNNEFTTKGEPYIPTESCRREFTLTPDDVRDFFDVAKPISFDDMAEARDLEQSQCHLLGKAVLQDGQEASWEINRFRRGYIGIPDGKNPRSFFYYCADCQSEKYHAPCDIDCVEAINRAEEGYGAPDPETGD
jgi:hypothetical protein